jgi:hypothetical protein
MIDLNGYSGTSGLGLKRSGAKAFLAIVFSVVLLISCGLWVASLVPDLLTPTISRDQLEAAARVITTAQQDGLLVRYTCTDNRAHVQPAEWGPLSEGRKEDLTTALAMTCQAERRGYRMTVVDFRTGRELANFSSGSFRVY